MIKFKRFWLPLFLWCALIFAASSIQVIKTPFLDIKDFIIKKSFHFTEYFILLLLTFRAFKNSLNLSLKNNYLLSLLFVILYAVSDEFHQTLVPTREGTLRDVIIDTLGGLAAAYYIWKLLPKAPKKLKNWAKKLQIS
jgi:hypothetical protein